MLLVQEGPGRVAGAVSTGKSWSWAGDTWSWRRWDFWWGTCTANHVPAHSSGAGPHHLFPTCTGNRFHLLQQPPLPAPIALPTCSSSLACLLSNWPIPPVSAISLTTHQWSLTFVSRLAFAVWQIVCAAETVQVFSDLGAGDTQSWRRWDFWWGTCTADHVPAHSSGAGPHHL